jgi:hypothetical protein
MQVSLYTDSVPRLTFEAALDRASRIGCRGRMSALT